MEKNSSNFWTYLGLLSLGVFIGQMFVDSDPVEKETQVEFTQAFILALDTVFSNDGMFFIIGTFFLLVTFPIVVKLFLDLIKQV